MKHCATRSRPTLALHANIQVLLVSHSDQIDAYKQLSRPSCPQLIAFRKMISLPQAPLSRAVSVEDCNKRLDGASLSGKNVLITGGASGVGAAIAQTYAEKG